MSLCRQPIRSVPFAASRGKCGAKAEIAAFAKCELTVIAKTRDQFCTGHVDGTLVQSLYCRQIAYENSVGSRYSLRQCRQHRK
jgi:hypothetical protein